MQKTRGIRIKLFFTFIAPLLVIKDAFLKFRDAFTEKNGNNTVDSVNFIFNQRKNLHLLSINQSYSLLGEITESMNLEIAFYDAVSYLRG